MIFRFSTAGAFSSNLDVIKALGATPFTVPTQRTTVLREFGGAMMQDGDFLAGVSPERRMNRLYETFFWMEQVLFPALALSNATSTLYNGPVLNNPQSRLMGGVSVAFVTVNPTQCVLGCIPGTSLESCLNGTSFIKLSCSQQCYGDYDVNAINTNCGGLGMFSNFTGLASVTGVIEQTYSGSGCQAEISSLATTSALSNQSWVTDGTRAVLFQFNLLNLNLGWIIQVKALVEQSATRLIATSIETRVAPLSVYANYNREYQALIIVSDVFLFLFALGSMWFWILRPRLRGFTTDLLRTLTTVWNFMALCLFFVVIAQIVVGITYEFSPPPIMLGSSTFQDLTAYTDFFYTFLGLNCVSLFLVILMVFKHLQMDPKTSILFQTLHRAARPLAAATFLFILAISSMSIWANLAWGGYMVSWLRIENCVALLSGLMFGAPVDFLSFRETQTTLLWVVFFYLIWLGFVFLVFIQLFGAIILDAYLEIRYVDLTRGNARHEEFFWTKFLTSPAAWVDRQSLEKKIDRKSKGISKFSLFLRRMRRRFLPK